jgi:hypothetical protein
MTHLGLLLACATVLAVASTASAQTPRGNAMPDAPGAGRDWVQPAPASKEPTTAIGARRHRPTLHARRHSRWRSPGDHIANRLNRQELRGGVVWYGRPSSYKGAIYGPSPYSAQSN